MEPILLNFNETEYSSHITKLGTAASQVREVVKQINAINSYQVNATGLRDLLQGRGEVLGEQITRATQAELDRAGIVSASIVNAARKGDAEKYWAIFRAFRQPASELAQFLTLNETGRVVVAENAEATIRKEYSYYLTTEQAHEAYKAHQKAVEYLNEFLRLCPQLHAMSLKNMVGVIPGNQFEALRIDYERAVQPRT